MEPRELKKRLVAKLRKATIPPGIAALDVRLAEYIEHVRIHSSGEDDVHNVDEVAACLRFLRFWNVYDRDEKRLRAFIRLMEGFTFDHLGGTSRIQMTPSQVFISAGIYLFVNGGRRVTTSAIIFIPRKYGKTWFVAGIAVDDFFFGDNDGEVHVVSNSLDQSQIAFKATKQMLLQIDPKGKEIRFTANTMNWKTTSTTGRRARIDAHTAGGKAKDGAKASVVLADEYGSAGYVKDHCDMSDAMNVYKSSMGPRLNPLTVITTTAGKVIEGPFELTLRNAQAILYRELEADMHSPMDDDYQFLFALHPDEWEYNDESFSDQRVWRKVNPHIGVTIQENYYAEMWRQAQGDPETYKEVVTKLFNKFVSNSSRPWINASDLRTLQTEKRIYDLDKSSWMCFASLDFSKGDDLCSISYTAFNRQTKQKFWDCAAWISEKTLHSNPNAPLYEEWIEKGYLKVCPGATIEPSMVLDEIKRASEHVNFVQFGFDPYDSKTFVNTIQTWIAGKLQGKMFGKTLERYLQHVLQPVSQTFANYNSSCQMVYEDVFSPNRTVYLSSSPLLPWAFGNAVLQESTDGYGNVKPVKRSANAKVDPCQCICTNYILMGKYTPFK